MKAWVPVCAIILLYDFEVVITYTSVVYILCDCVVPDILILGLK